MKTLFRTTSIAILTVCFLASFVGAWTEYKTHDAAASVKFPGKPEITEQNVASAIGELQMKLMMLEVPQDGKDPNLTYGLIYTDYPDTLIHSDMGDEFAAGFFESAANGAAGNVEGKVVSTVANKYGEYPGTRVKIDLAGEHFIEMQMYLVKNRTYMLQAIYPSDTENNVNLEQFFASFKLLK